MTDSSILNSGNGLFDTHVTIENVEEIVQKQLKTGSKLGKKTKITLIGEGNGIMSRILLVEPEWIPLDNHDLPSKFVLKIPFCLNVRGIIEKMRASNPLSKEQEESLWKMFETEAQSVHNREINLYKILETRKKKDVFLNPKLYFLNRFDSENKNKGFIGMEFVENAVVRHIDSNVKPQELYPVLKSLAHLQAESLHLNDEEIKSISGFDFAKMVGPMMDGEGMKSIFHQTREFNPEKFDGKIKKIEEFGQEIVNFELACNLNKYVGIKKDVLVHGDLWSPNILWNQRNGNYA